MKQFLLLLLFIGISGFLLAGNNPRNIDHPTTDKTVPNHFWGSDNQVSINPSFDPEYKTTAIIGLKAGAASTGTTFKYHQATRQAGASIAPDANGILYVNKNVVGGDGSGSSWANSIKELADALLWAREQYDADNNWLSGDSLRIFVAEGDYKPLYHVDNDKYHTDGGRDNSFLLINNVYVYGGFPNTGNPGWTDRNWVSHITTLNGDIGTPDDNSDNVYHVILSVEAHNIKFDGFTLTGANANDPTQTPVIVFTSNIQVTRTEGGGGLLIFYDTSSGVNFQNLIITENLANFGAGFSLRNGNPTFTNIKITNNTASNWGGAVSNSLSRPSFVNALIYGNTASQGGGIYNFYGFPRIYNTTLVNNTATNAGSGIYNVSMTPTQIPGQEQPPVPDTTTITNSILWNDQAGSGGAATDVLVISGPKYMKISHSIVAGDTVVAGIGNLKTDPGFINAVAADFQLPVLSDAVDSGNKDSIPTGITTDLAGNPRMIGNNVDMGAFENQTGKPLPVTILNFEGSLLNGMASIRWQSGVETGLGHYALEKSTDGKQYHTMTTLQGQGSNSSYSLSLSQAEQTAFYRLKMAYLDGTSEYHRITLSLTQNSDHPAITLYPNPAINYVNLQTEKAGQLLIYDANGRFVQSRILAVGANRLDIRNLAPGTYFGVTADQKLKFIKIK